MSAPTLVAGVDSSTQSTKVVVCDAGTGEVLRQGSAPHPEGVELDPEHWWNAFRAATDAALLDGVSAISVAAQQHGLVALGAGRQVVAPVSLWNDTRPAEAAASLVEELGGPGAWATAVGSVPTASFTVAKWRWMCDRDPALADRVEQLCLPHDWLTDRLIGDADRAVTTDRGDASGSGWWGLGGTRPDLVALAGRGREPAVPVVLAPAERAGVMPGGVLVGPGTGDNMAAALGVGAVDGDVVISLGTSGTAFAVSDTPTADRTGAVAGFADATGRWLPLVCTLNCARVFDAVGELLGGSIDELAQDAPPGSGGLVMLPYLDGERTPNLPRATGTLEGVTRANLTPAHLARAAVEGVLCGLADGVDALRSMGVAPRRAVLVGGASRSAAVQSVAPAILGLPTIVASPAEHVAIGAARQAAWVLAGSDDPPDWSALRSAVALDEPMEWGAEVRAAYEATRDRRHL